MRLIKNELSYRISIFTSNSPARTSALSSDPVHTVPDRYGHDMKLKSLKTSVAHEIMTILENFIPTIHRKRGESNYDWKLTELDVVNPVPCKRGLSAGKVSKEIKTTKKRVQVQVIFSVFRVSAIRHDSQGKRTEAITTPPSGNTQNLNISREARRLFTV